MYFNIFGGSALLHVLAAHPKLTAVFGLAATMGMLASPVGYGSYPGTARFAGQLEEIAATYGELDAATMETAQRASLKLAEMPTEVVHQAVSQMLASCGDHCAGVTTTMVMGDPELRSWVLYLHELDLMASARARSQGGARRNATTGAAQKKQ